MNIKYIKQDSEKTCTIACFAMMLGKTYTQIASQFSDRILKAGLSTEEIQNYLGEQGFTLITKRSSHYAHLQLNNVRMIKPFAPIHLVTVKVFSNSRYHHAVVMDSKGIVYDPVDIDSKNLSNYYGVIEVIGCFRD